MLDIAIVGDSFGAGEWQYDTANTGHLNLVHSGVGSFLSKSGHNVSNFCRGGAGMEDILDQIKIHKIKKQNLIVFATDSLRNIKPKEQLIKHLYIKKNYSIKKLHKILFLEWYDKLSSLTKQNDCNVILIGGSANLYETDQSNHIKICTTSWLSDIFKKPIGDLAGLSNDDMEFLIARKPIKTDEQKTEIIDIITQKSTKLNLMSESNLFPDDVHPNRSCHNILTKKIINFLT